jgi:hypothetical protein
MDFSSIVSAPPSGRTTAVLIDHERYAQTVILQGRAIPWTDPIAYSQFMGQAQGLLRPDTTLLDLGAFYDHALASNRSLAASLAARSRMGYALKTLLGDAKTATAAFDLATVIAQTARTPLVVQIPSPMLWLARTHVASGAGAITALGAEHAENAAMYVADWLRRFSTLRLSLLLLDERWPGAEQLCEVDGAVYTPVLNITEHYRWTLGRRTSAGVTIVGSNITGAPVPRGYWLGEDAIAPQGDFLFADIPANAVPETVLEQLAKLA